jgi:hypothetical protein
MYGRANRSFDYYIPLQGVDVSLNQICPKRNVLKESSFIYSRKAWVTCHNRSTWTSNVIQAKHGDLTSSYIACIPTIKCDLLQTIQECLYKGLKICYGYQQLFWIKQNHISRMGGQGFGKILENMKLRFRYAKFGHWIQLPWLKNLVQMRCLHNRKRGLQKFLLFTCNKSN